MYDSIHPLDLLIDLILSRNFFKNFFCLIYMSFTQKPPRTFWYKKYTDEKKNCGPCTRGKHPSPIILYIGKYIIREIREKNSTYNGQLIDRNHTAAFVGRTYFSDIQRR